MKRRIIHGKQTISLRYDTIFSSKSHSLIVVGIFSMYCLFRNLQTSGASVCGTVGMAEVSRKVTG